MSVCVCVYVFVCLCICVCALLCLLHPLRVSSATCNKIGNRCQGAGDSASGMASSRIELPKCIDAQHLRAAPSEQPNMQRRGSMLVVRYPKSDAPLWSV